MQQYASVVIGTEEGSALANIDYEPGLEELFFTPGMATQTVYVNILENPERASDRQFTIALDRSSDNVDDAAVEARRPSVPANDNTSLGTYARYLEQLGLTVPAAKSSPAKKAAEPPAPTPVPAPGRVSLSVLRGAVDKTG